MSTKFLLKATEESNVSMDSIKTEESDQLSETSSQSECMSGYSKKIVKKRKKYSKIDDQIRMKLLEDVQKNGDTLKAAAERYNVNYSSAKSIFHTYRKEGRILKKPANERYRRTPLLPPRSTINTAALVVSDNISAINNKVEIESPVQVNQVPSQLQQIESLSALLKAAQENSIIQQLQSIQNFLQKTIANQESANNSKENVQQMFIPKPIRLQDLCRMGSSTTPTNKQASLFSRSNSGVGFQARF
jgi:hypothetical protein